MNSLIQKRLTQVDAFVETADISMAGLPQPAINLAHDLCRHFDLHLGTLLRRASAIALADGENAADLTERLKEAAQHLIVR